jgi:hypothetical protein
MHQSAFFFRILTQEAKAHFNMAKIKHPIQRAKAKWQNAGTHDKIILLSALCYMIIISAFMVWHQEFFSPDRFFIFAFLAMLFLGRAWTFFWDWLPPMLLLLGYDYLRGLVPQISGKVHIHAMIDFDKLIFFGHVPTIWLQQHFFNGQIRWYDNVAVVLYSMHFITPLIVALIFWMLDRNYFKLYMAAMVILSYLAFFTYYLFPAMPPWMAAQQGFLPQVAQITSLTMAHFAHPISLPTVYNYVGANLVAAVPSLHAAYPLMTALFINKKFPRWGWAAFIYPLAMWVTVMYLGEHYFFDICAAIVYTLAIFAIIMEWDKVKNFFGWIFKKPAAAAES